MVGIVSYGAYIPLRRLGTSRRGWNLPGEKAVANWDEDSITMAVAAAHDCFTIREMVIMEDPGFCPRGKAPEYIKKGIFNLAGELAVNPDGGLKSFGHPIGASGLRMIYEIYKQMQGKAGPRQRNNPTLGLTHNFGMNPGSGIGSVTILGQRD
jgi:acetyl-CoA C-acetyltransferase